MRESKVRKANLVVDGAGRSALAQRLASPIQQFDLMDEVDKLRHGESWEKHGHNAKALVKHPDFRVTLTILKAGQRILGHKAEARISIQTVRGNLRLHLPEKIVELPKDHLLVLDKGIAHDVEAMGESAFLLSVSWPEDR